MPLKLALAALALVLLPAASPERIARAENIPVEEWKAMAMGRTLTYRINGELWAFEHYHPGTNRVTLQLYDGSCLHGTWEYAEPLYCFHWEGQGTSCFRHARVDGGILIVETQDGQDTPLTQDMSGVTDLPLTCGPAVTS
jgi:hypothetical protein